jgi:hypothetical protein
MATSKFVVERDRLLAAAAQLAQGLGAREQDAGAVGELAGAREEGIGVPELGVRRPCRRG